MHTSYVRSLEIMIPGEMQTGFKNRKTGEEPEVPVYDMTGQLRLWLPIALDKSMWNYHHIDKLKYPKKDPSTSATIPTQRQPQHPAPCKSTTE